MMAPCDGQKPQEQIQAKLLSSGRDQSPKLSQAEERRDLNVNFRNINCVPIGKTGTYLKHREEGGKVMVAVSAMSVEENILS